MAKLEIGAKAVIMKDEKILLLHKKTEKEDLWELPGGRLDYGESLEEAIEREIKEELGLNVRSLRLYDTWNLKLQGHQIAGVIFLCSLESYDLSLSDEHDRWTWFDPIKDDWAQVYTSFTDRMKDWDFNEVKAYFREEECL